MLWLIVMGGLVAAGTLGLWCPTRREEETALAKIIAEAAAKEADRAFEKEQAGLQPSEFWAAMVGRAFVFTVTRPREHSFVAAAMTVLPRGVVVQDLVGESLVLDYGALQWRPATQEDCRDANMVITPSEPDFVEEDEEEEEELV